MKLVICEKPSVGAAVAAALGVTGKKDGYIEGNGYVISWCIGHLVGLSEAAAYGEQYKKWSYDSLPILPQEWQYTVAADKGKQFKTLKELMHRADVSEVVNACDAGREGELIFRFVYHQAGCKKPFTRLWISSMETGAIKSGLANRKIKYLFCSILSCILVFVLISAVLVNLDIRNTVYYIIFCGVCMGAAILLFCYGFFREQHKIMENAISQITEYISGNKDVTIECNDEGELYRLFHEVNSLVAILNAHVENEKSAKKFLRNIISDISHQLKTPLAALNIYNGIIQDEAKELPTIQEFSQLSEQELDRIEILVQSLLKITKLDAGTITLEKSLENVSELAKNIKKHFLFRAEQEGKEICLSGNEEVTLLCDRNWITEAVSNLVKNALDHTEKGGIIRIEWRAFTSIVQITVRDNGSGIHPEDLHHIFKRFYRSRFSKDTQGIGLGLSLTKAIVEAHNGTIEVDSTLGTGTSFTINFLNPTKL